MQPMVRVHIGQPPSYLHILPRRKVVVRCALVPGAAYTVIYSWWWLQEASETCRV